MLATKSSPKRNEHWVAVWLKSPGFSRGFMQMPLLFSTMAKFLWNLVYKTSEQPTILVITLYLASPSTQDPGSNPDWVLSPYATAWFFPWNNSLYGFPHTSIWNFFIIFSSRLAAIIENISRFVTLLALRPPINVCAVCTPAGVLQYDYYHTHYDLLPKISTYKQKHTTVILFTNDILEQ